MIIIEVRDNGVQNALQALAKRVSNMKPVLQTIGEDIMERTKERFVTGAGPDGRRWQGNSVATIQALLARSSKSKGFYLKDGKTLSKKAQTSLAGKKVLVNTGDLASKFHVSANANSVTVGSSMIYAAMQQFGGKKSKFPNLWGDIPARPFLPIKSDGSLYPQEQTKILDAINLYLAGK